MAGCIMKKKILINLFIILFSLLFASDNKIKFYLFYSDECELCHDVMENLIPDLENYYNIEYKKFEISNEENLILLDKLENQYGKTAEIPEIFIGKYLIGGKDVKDKLEEYIRSYETIGCEYPKIESTIKKDSITVTDKKIYLAYFYKNGCLHCQKTYQQLKLLKSKFPNLVIKKFNMSKREAIELNEALCQYYRVPKDKHLLWPMIFVGNKYFLPQTANYQNLQSAIADSSAYFPPWERVNLSQVSQNIQNRFESFGIFTIALAGLIDGINPCAFATIIFLISYLAILKRKGKEIIIIGAAYTTSVFITYFLVGILGLNIFTYLQSLKILSLFIKILFITVAALAFLFSFYSLYDFFLVKKGKASDMKLQLPLKLKKKIHKNIREKAKTSNLIIGSIIIGFLVSLEELFCTGQVYLPTLIYMSKFAKYQNIAYLYLTLYNILFILPLVIVFLAYYKGISSVYLSKLMKKNLASIKLVMFALFLLLGMVLLITVFQS